MIDGLFSMGSMIGRAAESLAGTIALQTGYGAARFAGATLQDMNAAIRKRSKSDGLEGIIARRLQPLLEGRNRPPANFPPRYEGVPFVGSTLDFLIDPIPVVEAGFMEHGPVFSVRLGKEDAVVLLGPEPNRLFFTKTDKSLSMRDAYQFLLRMFAGNVYFLAPEDEYKVQKSIVLPRFSKKMMESYVTAMTAETERFLETMGQSGTFEAPQELGPLVMHIAARALLGESFRDLMADDLFGTFRVFSEGIEPVLPLWVPLPRFRRSAEAKERLNKIFQGAIDERRRMTNGPQDFLQILLDEAKDAKMDDALICHLIMMLVWAGHETTLGQTSWVLADLLQNPDYLASVLEEQDEVLGDGPLTAEKLQQLQLIDWAIQETERLHPVAHMVFRKATDTFEVGGYRIPAGTSVIASPWVSHRLSTVFSNPHRYDPERFSPERREDKLPYSMIGFGGAAHLCAGINFANQEMKIITTLLLRRYTMSLMTSEIYPVRAGKTRWPQDFEVSYRPRERGAAPSLIRPEPARAAAASSQTPEECPFHKT